MALELHSLSKMYKNSDTYANKNINLVFYPGEITALIGHNGAGKTTLLNQIIGITKPTKGSITYNQISFVSNSKIARNYVSMMPQLHAPLSGITIAQSIEAILKIRGFNNRMAKIRSREMVRALHIEKWENVKGEYLSGGLRRLSSFAMTVADPSEIIILDEPTNDVDPIRRELIWHYLKKLAKAGHIIIVVTHNLLEVEKYADRSLLMKKGKIQEDTCLNDNLHTNLNNHHLEVYFDKLTDLKQVTFPPHLMVQINKEKRLLILEMYHDDVLNAIMRVMTLLEEKKITHYKLSSTSFESLNESYSKKDW